MKKLLIVSLGLFASISALHGMDDLWVGFVSKLSIRKGPCLIRVEVGSSLLKAIKNFLKTFPGNVDQHALVFSIGDVQATIADLTEHGEILHSNNGSPAGALHITSMSKLTAIYGTQAIDLNQHPIHCSYKEDLN